MYIDTLREHKSTKVVDLEKPTFRAQGRVKWFDPAKGFGFIVSEESGEDILLHANVLHGFGQNSIADNTHVSVLAKHTARGAQAVELTSVHVEESSDCSHFEDRSDADASTIAALPWKPARVRWFDKDKGYGFANVYGRDDDVFVHIEVLLRSGFGDLKTGEALCLRVIDGKRGLMAAQVASWDMALRVKAPHCLP